MKINQIAIHESISLKQALWNNNNDYNNIYYSFNVKQFKYGSKNTINCKTSTIA